ncbi:MAG: EAL domain-containing protein [Mesorhizobium sp.]|jgi:sensor c-di-GMP phosphodiesterase-like protein
MQRSARKYAWAVGLAGCLLGCLIGAVIGLLLGQVVSVEMTDRQLARHASVVLERAVHVAQNNSSVLSAADALETTPCSDADLDALRRISFLSEYPGDVGRVESGAVLCTALWGRLPLPVVLPPPQRVAPNGTELWANIPNVDHKIITHVSSRGNAIVFTSPKPFQSFQHGDDGLATWIVTKDHKYTYRRLGGADGLTLPPGKAETSWFDMRLYRAVSTCSASLDICVVASRNAVNVLWPLDALFASVAMLGALSGGGISLAAFLYRYGSRSFSEKIRQAIEGGRLTLVYQPLVRIHDRQMVGVEALARLTDEYGEDIAPDVFIKVAEEGGFIDRVARIVIRTALKEMRSRLKATAGFHCGINLSTGDILDETLCDFLDREVKSHGLEPSQVVLEVTERATADPEQLIGSMEKFRQRGYAFYLDDFGTGYSNLAYLAHLPISGIKLDRMFTQAIGKEAMGSTIAENVCAVAKALNLQLIVEGIETEEQAQYIDRLSPAAIGQGWLYGRPVPAEKLRK